MLPPEKRKLVLRDLSEKRIGLQEALAALRNGSHNSDAETPAALSPAISTEARPSSADVRLIELTSAHLESVFARKLGLDLKLDRNSTFEPLGIDSVKILELVRLLEQTFGTLPKTLLFEFNTLNRLSGYFVSNHRATLMRVLGVKQDDCLTVPAPVFKGDKKVSRSSGDNNDVAIVGLAVRFPGARNVDEFWENLASGRSSIRLTPDGRFPDGANTSLRKWGGFIDDVDKFDPLFFGISPREAEQMDPQERLFLEVAWETLEDAGYTRERLIRATHDLETGSDVGVFVGVMYGSYQLYGAQTGAEENSPGPSSPYWSIPNRVSYFCNFHGPSLAVDTACSASLTAIHLASESIRRGECGAALAGGVTLLVHDRQMQTLASMKMLSHDDKCRAFGNGADGMVVGEGVGAVLLRPLRDALRDGDRIHGVIKGSSINSGGKNGGYTVPDPVSQGNVVVAAFRRAGIDPKTVSCLEAHGTGTALGDPIEVRGLTKAFGENAGQQFCALGSVKSNIGHLQAAAGIAGIAKVLLQLKYRQLVPTLHAEEANPFIDFKESPFYLPKSLQPWNSSNSNGPSQVPLRAGVSSFGIGGANAHILIQEPPKETRTSPKTSGQFLLPLSARTAENLRDYAVRCREWITARTNAELDLAQLTFNWQTGRESMEFRLALVVVSREDLLLKLNHFVTRGAGSGIFCSTGLDKNHPILTTVSGLLTGGDFVRNLFKRGELDELAALWAAGFDLDWSILNEGRSHARISLPTYPFSRRSLWVRSAQQATPKSTDSPPISKIETAAPDAQQSKMIFTEKHGIERKTTIEIQEWLIQQIAVDLKMEQYEVDTARPFNDFGVDSLVGTALAKRLGDWLKLELQSTLLWEYPTIKTLAQHLATFSTQVQLVVANPPPPHLQDDSVVRDENEIDAWIDDLTATQNATLQRF
ncbi:MAG: pksL 4 [Verrucomicrobiales bacterium]|nr:pksL 4 [Verrucomicrobiales bacterium]